MSGLATADTATTDTATEALAAGLLSVDASRRVGWAKAFENARRVESMEEQIRVLTAEKKALRRAYSRLLGFVQGLPGSKSPIYDEEVAAHTKAERPFRHTDAYGKGLAVADRHHAFVTERTEEQQLKREEKQAMSRRRDEQLRDDANQRGHRVRQQSVSDESILAVCSCGDTWDGLATCVWKSVNDHYAFVVYGVEYRVFYKEWKAKA